MNAALNEATFLFTLWEGGGNIPPTIETARKLVAAGHRVRCLGDSCNRPEVEACGASFVSWTRAPNRIDRSPESQTFKDWAAATPQEGLVAVIRDCWAAPSLAYAMDTVDELKRSPVDMVVAGEPLLGVMAGCESIGQPFVILGSAISFTPLPGIPPLGPGLPPARNAQERAMHAEIARASQAMFDSGLPKFNEARAALGLPPLVHLLDQYQAAERELLPTSAAFDFPPSQAIERIRYVGPQLADPHWAREWTSPWTASDARPLVVVGFSTTFQNHAAVLQRTIDALAPLPVRVLVTLGGAIRRDALRAADNCAVVDSAPHSVVMPQAAFVVTHGGHGTVIRALISRVPMLVIPLGRDQADNAVRVTQRGAGLSLPANAAVEQLRSACERLLTEPAFREAARRLGDLVAADAERSTVVQELEASIGLARRTSS
jgi:UDP:flavonoid glycosyltransferase YjiC (YdhE family)